MSKRKLPSIHIACYDDGHIVPRMMSWLVDEFDWSIGDNIDFGADINYFAPYTMYGRYGFSMSKAMAWFTHAELDNHAKMNIWNKAKIACNLALVTAEIYRKQLSGTAVHRITPGIDQSHFVPVKRKRPGKGIVGLSGKPSPRKGIGLAAAISGNKQVKQLIAIGGDWPEIDSHIIPYTEIPDFYSKLDVLVCTSIIEGIPAPPLEALACGVPVVVPCGVGMMGELIDKKGVYHYAAGSETAMNKAISLALQEKASRTDIRSTVAAYTKQAWCASHGQAVEMLA